jgi:peroxiredoxin
MALEVGDVAPDFELASHAAKDKKVKLSDFCGTKNVLIAFYPLAWTPV